MTADPPPGQGAAAQPAENPGAAAAGGPGFAAVLRYFLRLGTLGFGGPIAVVGYMQRDLVQQGGWIARQDFLDGVALGQTMPGPLAAPGRHVGRVPAPWPLRPRSSQLLASFSPLAGAAD